MAQKRNPKTHPKREDVYTEEDEEVVYEEEEVIEYEEIFEEEVTASAVQESGDVQEEWPPLIKEEVCPEFLETEVKAAVDNKNGKKTEGGGGGSGGVVVGPKYTMFTWFVVLALLGVWSSVAVVYFDIVDYDSVIARAKEFRVNFSEVLQGKLTAYDRDGDGDFDMEDAKVLLDEKKLKGSDLPKEKLTKEERLGEVAPDQNGSQGLKDPEAPKAGGGPAREIGTNEQTSEASTINDQVAKQQEAPLGSATSPDNSDGVYGSQDVESEIQAAVPLPPLVEDDFVPDDPREESGHPYGEEPDTIDTTGALVEEEMSEESLIESGQYVTSSRVTQQREPELEPQRSSDAHLHTEPPEPAESQTAAVEQEQQTESTGDKDSSHKAVESQSAQKAKEKASAKKSKPKLLNKLDKTIKAEIDAAEKLRKKGKLEEAARAFDSLVQQNPQSPRARYGKAQVEDDLAEKMRSNDMLQKAINTYREAAELPAATSDLIRTSMKRRAERQQFLGRMRGALVTLQKLVQIFPKDIGLKNDLGVSHLLLGDNKGAKKVYEEVLAVAPDDGFAKVHYGFILKSENKIEESIPYLMEGLESGEPGTDDGRFYFHLGDALQRVGDDTAYHWYELGHQRGHFASVWQRSLYNVDGLKAQPWWTAKETGYTELVKALESSWRTIRKEVQGVMNQQTGLFLPEEENLRETGEWGQYTLWQQGRKAVDACRVVPKTCALLERFPEAINCKRGQIKFSVMQPGTHVWPHTGPTNCRLRMHLGLVVPKRGCRIRCTNQTREWEEGKVLIFDDSFEHEVWQEADSYRLIFIVDVWHPELTPHQRQTLSAI